MTRKNQWKRPIHRFECDKRKARSNFHKHGLRFTDGCRVFAGHTLTAPSKQNVSDREHRYVTIGALSDGLAAVVVWTRRVDSIRIISVRKARRYEREQFNAHIAKALS